MPSSLQKAFPCSFSFHFDPRTIQGKYSHHQFKGEEAEAETFSNLRKSTKIRS